MIIKLPLEIIINIYNIIKADITLEYYLCLISEYKRSRLTDYRYSNKIKTETFSLVVSNINCNKLTTIKNARLVCKNSYININDVINLTNCSFGYYYYDSLIYNVPYYDKDIYRKYYNRLRIKNLIARKIIQRIAFIEEPNWSFTTNRRLIEMTGSDRFFRDKDILNTQPPRQSNHNKLSHSKTINNYYIFNVKLPKSRITQHRNITFKHPKIKIYNKNYYR